MNTRLKNSIDPRRMNRTGWIRLACMLCIVCLFASCIGCTSNNSTDFSEDPDALNATLTEKILFLQSMCEVAEQETNALKSRIEKAEREIATQAAQNATLTEALDALKKEYEATKQALDHLREEMQALQNALPPAEPTKKIRIYIDQGHNPTGHHNTGATGNGLYEQDLTFTIGLLLAKRLEEDGRFEICLSRPTADTVLGTDNTSSLAARMHGAQTFNADYFISLHINAFSSDTANGIEVYTADPSGTSYTFGSHLLGGLVDATNLRNRGMKQNQSLYVLKNATMPAVLLEMGFISNTQDATLLAQNPACFAEGIYQGILSYFDFPASSSR